MAAIGYILHGKHRSVFLEYIIWTANRGAVFSPITRQSLSNSQRSQLPKTRSVTLPITGQSLTNRKSQGSHFGISLTGHHITLYNHCSETPHPTYQITVHITRSSDTAVQSYAGISRSEKTLTADHRVVTQQPSVGQSAGQSWSSHLANHGEVTPQRTVQ